MRNAFNYDILILARQARKVSQPQLATLLDKKVSQAQLSKIEHGIIEPSKEVVAMIADALKFKPSFFYHPSYSRMPPVSFHRKRQKLGQKNLDAIHAQAEIYRLNLKKLLESVELEFTNPPVAAIDVDQYDGDISAISEVMRQRWKLPRGPIQDITDVIENAGVIVVSFDFGTPLIDGFCQHACDGLPAIIFMNLAQPKDRYRFSLAHELGHLVMHQVPNPEMEMQANLFAAEFLMPTKDISSQLYNLSLQKFMDLKLHWKVSMQALIYKSWKVGKLTDRMYKYYQVEMSKRGFKTKEPIELTNTKESPSLLKDLINVHLNKLNYKQSDLEEIFGLYENDFNAFYPMQINKPRLRIVK